MQSRAQKAYRHSEMAREMVISNGSAKKRGRPWGSKKDKDNPHHPHGGWPPAQKGTAHGVEEIVYDGNEIAFVQKKIACSRIINTARTTARRTKAVKRFASHRSSIPFPHSPLHFRVAPLVWLCQIHVFPLPPKSCRKRSRNGRSASPATLICPAKRLCVSRGSAFHGKFPETSQEPSLRKMPDRAPYTTVDKEHL